MTKFGIKMVTESVDAYNKTIYFELYDRMTFRSIERMTLSELSDLTIEVRKINEHYNERMLKW